MTVKVGDKVTTTATHDVNGTHLASFVRSNTYDVIQVNGNRVVIGKGSAVTAAVDAGTLSVVGGSSAPITPITPSTIPLTPAAPETVATISTYEDKMSSSAIESALTALLKSGGNYDVLNYSMRLFGVPHQFTKYCDPRQYSDDPDNVKKVGRKFIENIMLEAPIVTFIPGKPLYLPAAKNKKGLSYALLSSANGTMSNLMNVPSIINDEKLHEKLRYYDFQQDYYEYMRYVNILCATGAAFLDLQDVTINGTPLTKYDWKNYRMTSETYSTATSNALKHSAKQVENFVNTLKTYGANVLSTLQGESSQSVDAFNANSSEDPDLLSALESILTQTNFVQFYVDPSSGLSESAENSTAASKIEGMFESGSELMKEVAFLANSGGIDAGELGNTLDGAVDALNAQLTGGSTGTLGGIMSRVMSSASNVIKGDNMIFPEIYQNSKYTKNYTIIVDLRSPYGNKLSYYLNVLVPLFHLMALAIPKQTTANTYGSPFLVKAYYPGIFSCNLGILQGITIDKNPNGDAWTVDGYPSEIKVTINLTDLYSDLSMTPAGDIVLFLGNSSLIEYIATSCGVNLTVPQLKNRVATIATSVVAGLENLKQEVSINIFSGVENIIASFTGV